MKKRAIFLDRDGTLNEDPNYLNHPNQVKLLPGVTQGLALLQKAGFLLIVISNQSGVGRGLIQLSAIPEIHARLDDLLRTAGIRLDDYFLCFHTPHDHCACRKPKPKLLLEAAEKHGISLSESFMIGDKSSDLAAGHAAGCKRVILVRTGEGQETEREIKKHNTKEPGFIADSLQQAAQWILSQESANSSENPHSAQANDKS